MGYLRKDHVIGALEDDKTGTMACYEREQDRNVIKLCYESMEYVLDGLPQYRANNVYEDTNDAERWIPVTEKLPEMHMQKHSIDCHSDVVTVTVKTTWSHGETTYHVSTDMMHLNEKGEICWLMSCGFDGSAVYDQEIIAWMPLPEPYKEVEEYEKNV